MRKEMRKNVFGRLKVNPADLITKLLAVERFEALIEHIVVTKNYFPKLLVSEKGVLKQDSVVVGTYNQG